MSKRSKVIKSRPDDPDMPIRYGSCIILPFVFLSMIIAVFKVLFKIVKPKSTLRKEKEKK